MPFRASGSVITNSTTNLNVSAFLFMQLSLSFNLVTCGLFPLCSSRAGEFPAKLSEISRKWFPYYHVHPRLYR